MKNDTVCGRDEGGEEAMCVRHLSEHLGLPPYTIHYRTKGSRQPGRTAHRLSCELKWQGRCLVPIGVILQLEDQLASRP